jgi:hypothetical protein
VIIIIGFSENIVYRELHRLASAYEVFDRSIKKKLKRFLSDLFEDFFETSSSFIRSVAVGLYLTMTKRNSHYTYTFISSLKMIITNPYESAHNNKGTLLCSISS